MEARREKKAKKGLIVKTWERCKSLGRNGHMDPRALMMRKSKSWPRVGNEEDRRRVKKSRPPEGCFTVYVGPERQRFAVKTEHANHPLFRMLLEEAESEYGYCSAGPLSLPCDVDLFWKVLMEMDDGGREVRRGCGIARSPSSYRVLTQSPVVAMNRFL